MRLFFALCRQSPLRSQIGFAKIVGMDALRQAEAQAAQKLHAALPAETPAGIRPMECVWFLIALVLFLAHLEKSDVSHQVIAEKAQLAECKTRVRQYATALTTLLNEKPIVIGETTRVSCKVREISS